jgi:hypothetical protein
MQEDIYASPSSNLEDVDSSQFQSEFYVVSKNKFYALYLLTLGLYGIYWHYKNWSINKEKNNDDTWPVMRGLFSIFFTHALFEIVDMKIKDQEKEYKWNPGTVATIVVILNIAINVFDRLSMKNIWSPYSDILSVVLLPLLAISTHKAQQAINIACNDISGEANSNFTMWNFLWMFIGGVLIVGYFFPS